MAFFISAASHMKSHYRDLLKGGGIAKKIKHWCMPYIYIYILHFGLNKATKVYYTFLIIFTAI